MKLTVWEKIQKVIRLEICFWVSIYIIKGKSLPSKFLKWLSRKQEDKRQTTSEDDSQEEVGITSGEEDSREEMESSNTRCQTDLCY